MAGWIKLHRKILNSDFYQDLTGRQRDVIITLLLMADHEESEWMFKGVMYKTYPGEIHTSLEKIRKKCGKDCTRQVVVGTLLKAEQSGFITKTHYSTHTLITIVNWGLYQDGQSDNKQFRNTLDTKQKCIQTPNKKKEERNIYSCTSKELQLSKKLFSYMQKNNPKCKEPNWDRWCKDMDLMLRVDKRDPEEIEHLIKESQTDEFWKSNILSVGKLRKQFDRLIIQFPFRSLTNEGGENDDGWSNI